MMHTVLNTHNTYWIVPIFGNIKILEVNLFSIKAGEVDDLRISVQITLNNLNQARFDFPG